MSPISYWHSRPLGAPENKDERSYLVSPNQISDVVYERLCCRWRQRLLEQAAVPVLVIGVKMLADPEYGRTVLCTLPEFDALELAQLCEAVALELRKDGFEKQPSKD